MDILNMPPVELISFLADNFSYELPDHIISTSDDMNNASDLLLRLSGAYSYLLEMLSCAKVDVRNRKRIYTESKKAEDKTAYEDAIDRKDIIENKTDAVKQLYQGLSRAVTIHIENNNELKQLHLV